jgi:hypothetical protein
MIAKIVLGINIKGLYTAKLMTFFASLIGIIKEKRTM